ncbi:MAG: COX15/CtaA family protein [Rubrivivax sp.]|nr:COX15/CtaA family protein [Rubrivivax sp.]
MDSSLYDLGPAIRLVLLAVMVALGPLAWVWVRRGAADPAARWRALTRLILFLSFDLVLFGAFTRLTDSGLGCPDWPGCYGHASPMGAAAPIAAAEAALPDGPVTLTKAWIEMIHRYAATMIGVLITVSMALAWWLQRRHASPGVLPGWATLTFVWVCIQGAFGALTVTMKLQPAIVTLHLLGGYVLLALLVRQAEAGRSQVGGPSAGLRRAGAAVLLLVLVQSALGAWVSTNYAVLACSDFPQCQGSWWPRMDFEHGFTVWRDLGRTGDGALLPFEALTAIHWVHRLAAVAVLAALLVLAWALHRHAERSVRHHGQALALLALWQLASGLSNVVLDWPIVAALAHTGGAAALVVVLSSLLMLGRAAAAAPAPTAASAPVRCAAAPARSAGPA